MPIPAEVPDTAHQHALALGALGLRVIPIRPGKKHPPMNSWQHAATNDPELIDNWYNGLYSKAGVGLALGPQPCGAFLFAIDVDTHDPTCNGWDALAELEAQHGKLPDTWRSLTGADGGHLVFAAPPGVVVRNQQASGNRIAPGIDVRGEGGQIVVAPTIHPDTQKAYAWEHGYAPWETPVAMAPDWLLELVREPEVVERAASTAGAPQSSILNPQSSDSIAESVREWFDWHHELTSRGWTPHHADGGDTYWTRPGKDKRQGHSAVQHGGDVLVIFTTAIDHSWKRCGIPTKDGSGFSFSPFGFIAAADYGGDRSAAARGLRAAQTPGTSSSITDADACDEDEYDAELLDMLVDWDDFWATDHKAEEWMWEPVIAARRATAIFAKGGVGKSLIVLRMVLDMVATGVRVLYLDYEMTPDDLADRLADMGVDEGADLSGLRYAQLPSIPAFDTPAGGKAVRRFAQLVDAHVVIIDTFARAVEGDENDADTVRQFYRMTGLHLKADGRGFVRIDHAGKDDAKGQRGTSAKNDDVDVVWHLKRTETGYHLENKKKRMGWVPENVHLDRTDDPFVLKVSGGTAYPVGTNEVAKTLDELGVAEGASYRVAAKALSEAGRPTRHELVRAAVKYRRDRSSSLHFVGDLVALSRDSATTQSADSASQNPGRAPSDDTPDAVSGRGGAEDENNQVDDPGRGAGRGGTRTAAAPGTRCVPPLGDARASGVAETDSEHPKPDVSAFFGDDPEPFAPY